MCTCIPKEMLGKNFLYGIIKLQSFGYLFDALEPHNILLITKNI